jgi:hypothetical protein
MPEYPAFAWQEALVNAVAHRDCNEQGREIEIGFFDDRMGIQSPGELVPPVTIDKLKSRQRIHASRNPLMVRVLVDIGIMRETVSRNLKICRSPKPHRWRSWERCFWRQWAATIPVNKRQIISAQPVGRNLGSSTFLVSVLSYFRSFAEKIILMIAGDFVDRKLRIIKRNLLPTAFLQNLDFNKYAVSVVI